MVCKFNKFGFCKFKSMCNLSHIDDICSEVKCTTINCDKLHPRTCKYFAKFKMCKFGTNCKFSHQEIENRDLQVDNLKKEIEKLKDENKLMKEKLDFFEESFKNHSEAAKKDISCDKCQKPFENMKGLKIHMKTCSLKLTQLDGNVSINDVESNTCEDNEDAYACENDNFGDEQNDEMMENIDDTNNINEDEDFDIFSDNVKVEMIGRYWYHYCSNCESCINSSEILKNHMVSEHLNNTCA